MAVIIGDDERAGGTAVVRPLRDGGDQRVVDRADLVTHRRRVWETHEPRSATSMRSDLCGDVAPRRRRAHRRAVRLGRSPARARRAPRLRRSAGPQRARAVRRRQHDRRAQRVRRARSPASSGSGPPGRSTTNLPTGEVEVGECTVEVLRAATPPPFPIDARADDVDENVRLQYRYLDIRRERMQRNLRLRARRQLGRCAGRWRRRASSRSRRRCSCRRRPEGAREFLVPSRQEPGSFYALPQSPQLFKQLLMVAGVDRYYQIARCLRDEDLRADRQYEFMQLDAEMSFVDRRTTCSVRSARPCCRPPRPSRASAHRRSSASRGTRRWTASASTSPTCASGWSSSS